MSSMSLKSMILSQKARPQLLFLNTCHLRPCRLFVHHSFRLSVHHNSKYYYLVHLCLCLAHPHPAPNDVNDVYSTAAPGGMNVPVKVHKSFVVAIMLL